MSGAGGTTRRMPGLAAAVTLAVIALAGGAWAMSPTVVAVGSGPIAHVAVVAERRFPGMRQELVLHGRRHDASGPVETVRLGCTSGPRGNRPSKPVRAIRREGDVLRIELGERDACGIGTPRHAVVAGQAVEIGVAPARAVAHR